MDLKQKARQLPEQPGVYIMKDSGANIIYIGKAKSLRNRVSQYFQSSSRHAPKILRMVEGIRDFDYILADTELEALLLECRLIKDFKPMYNSQLKNDRKYIYIWVNTSEKYPVPELAAEKQQGICFGPYTSLGNVERGINAIKENTNIRYCKSFSNRTSGCLNNQLGYCLAPCTNEMSKAEYLQHLNEAVKFLEGKDMSLIKKLEDKMKTAADNLDFGKAAKYRDDVRALKHLINKQKTIDFSGRNRLVLALEKINDLEYKLFLIKGIRVIYKERMVISEDKHALKMYIVNLAIRFKEIELGTEAAELDKSEIDQGQIVYSYLKNKKDCCHMVIPKSWLKDRDTNKLELGVNKLIADFYEKKAEQMLLCF